MHNAKHQISTPAALQDILNASSFEPEHHDPDFRIIVFAVKLPVVASMASANPPSSVAM